MTEMTEWWQALLISIPSAVLGGAVVGIVTLVAQWRQQKHELAMQAERFEEERRTAREDVAAEINQGLRRMLLAWMDRGARVAWLAIEVDSKARHGPPPLPLQEVSDRLRFGPNFPTLQTWRIMDDTLRGFVDDHREAASTLRTLCLYPAKDESVIKDLANLMTELPRKITLRMDELGWPQAHWEAAE